MNVQSKFHFRVIACVLSGLLVSSPAFAQDEVSLTAEELKYRTITIPKAWIQDSPYLCSAAQNSEGPIVLPGTHGTAHLNVVAKRLKQIYEGGKRKSEDDLSYDIRCMCKGGQPNDWAWELRLAHKLGYSKWLQALIGCTAARLQEVPFKIPSSSGLMNWLSGTDYKASLAGLNPEIDQFARTIGTEIERTVAQHIIPYAVLGSMKFQYPVEDIEFNPDGTEIGLGFNTSVACVMKQEPSGAYVLACSLDHDSEDMVYGVDFGLDEGFITTRLCGPKVHLWSKEGEGYKLCKVLESHGYLMCTVATSNGVRIATRSYADNAIHIWGQQVDGGYELIGDPVQYSGGKTDLLSNCVFSADGRYIATTRNKKIYVWQQSEDGNYHLVGDFLSEGYCESLQFSFDGKHIKGQVYDYGDNKRSFVGTCFLQQQEEGQYQQIAEEPDSVVWPENLHDGGVSIEKNLYDNKVTITQKATSGKTVLQHDTPVTEAAASRSGDRIVTATEDNQAIIWGRVEGKQFDTLLKALDYYHKNRDEK